MEIVALRDLPMGLAYWVLVQ
jgi:hypothetical protein